MDMWPAQRSTFSKRSRCRRIRRCASAPNLVLTPHLGASTAEAQESVGIEIAQSIRAALLEGTIRNAVNMPNLDAKTLGDHRTAPAFRRKARPISVADRAETRRNAQHQLQRQSERSRYHRDHARGLERLSCKSPAAAK